MVKTESSNDVLTLKIENCYKDNNDKSIGFEKIKFHYIIIGTMYM